MNDEQLEMALRRYRPAEPGANIRRRVLTAASAPPRVNLGVVDWALAAAAAILAVAGFTGGAAGQPDAAVARQREVAEVATALGGGIDAAQYAGRLVPSLEDQRKAAVEEQATW